jgi:uncharacterized protein Usg
MSTIPSGSALKDSTLSVTSLKESEMAVPVIYEKFPHLVAAFKRKYDLNSDCPTVHLFLEFLESEDFSIVHSREKLELYGIKIIESSDFNETDEE